MKKIIFISLLTFYFQLLTCYSQNWQWAKQMGSTYIYYSDYLISLISDGTNTYAIGSYGGVLYMPNDTLYCNGNDDSYIVKYDPSGNIIWAKTMGGNYNLMDAHEVANAVYDPINNCIYITGTFINSITLGTTTLNSMNGSNEDIFVARMDLNGNFIWVKNGGGIGVDKSKIFVNPFGKIYLVTQTSDSATFDNFHLGPGGGIIQYDANGTCLSAQLKFTAPIFSNQSSVGLNFINTDIIYYGAFKSIPFQIDTATLLTKGHYDGLLARADSMGNIKWIKTFGDTGWDGVQSIAIDNASNIYITGLFQDSINIGGLPIVNNGKDILIAKLDQNGNIIWAKHPFSTGTTAYGSQIISDENGNCYITGAFSGTATFGSTTISTSNPADMFITRYDNTGNCLGVLNFGQASGSKVAIDNSGSVYCGGTFQNTISIGSTSMTSYYAIDIFVAKLDAITNIGQRSFSKNNDLVIYANPNKGIFNIKVPDEVKDLQGAILIVYDAMGKETARFALDNQSEKPHFDVSDSKTGTYIVRLIKGNKIYTGKLLVQ